VVLEDRDQLLHDLLVGALDQLTAPLNLRARAEQRAAAVVVIEVLA
jgi:hypothetical protein